MQQSVFGTEDNHPILLNHHRGVVVIAIFAIRFPDSQGFLGTCIHGYDGVPHATAEDGGAIGGESDALAHLVLFGSIDGSP